MRCEADRNGNARFNGNEREWRVLIHEGDIGVHLVKPSTYLPLFQPLFFDFKGYRKGEITGGINSV